MAAGHAALAGRLHRGSHVRRQWCSKPVVYPRRVGKRYPASPALSVARFDWHTARRCNPGIHQRAIAEIGDRRLHAALRGLLRISPITASSGAPHAEDRRSGWLLRWLPWGGGFAFGRVTDHVVRHATLDQRGDERSTASLQRGDPRDRGRDFFLAGVLHAGHIDSNGYCITRHDRLVSDWHCRFSQAFRPTVQTPADLAAVQCGCAFGTARTRLIRCDRFQWAPRHLQRPDQMV
nr:hypothetical protein [uncultured bacterium]